jgi:DtxR family Mn-dependent transcriptional regulator
MASAIGEPTEDPHGAPIPTRDGLVDERRLRSVADLGVGEKATVRRVSDDDAERLRYLAEQGIVIGTELQLVARAPYDGPLTVRLGRTTRQLGPALAAQILIEPTPAGG